ncbi:Glutathione S-transferase F3 [Diplonema papillatum]|nr:Glutathione S-transferase F3 [Diplonema papillatum]
MPALYANKVSQPCRSLLWFIDYANRKDIDIRIVDVQARDHKRPEFLAKFPSGQIPAYEEGDLLFSESTAILENLAHNHPLPPTLLFPHSSDPPCVPSQLHGDSEVKVLEKQKKVSFVRYARSACVSTHG